MSTTSLWCVMRYDIFATTGMTYHSHNWYHSTDSNLAHGFVSIAIVQSCLVGGWATPLKKYEFVNWDD